MHQVEVRDTITNIQKTRMGLQEILDEGLKEGFFEFSVSIRLGKDKRREVCIIAGKSQKFVIQKDEINSIILRDS